MMYGKLLAAQLCALAMIGGFHIVQEREDGCREGAACCTEKTCCGDESACCPEAKCCGKQPAGEMKTIRAAEPVPEAARSFARKVKKLILKIQAVLKKEGCCPSAGPSTGAEGCCPSAGPSSDPEECCPPAEKTEEQGIAERKGAGCCGG